MKAKSLEEEIERSYSEQTKPRKEQSYMNRIEDPIVGYWFDGDLYCPLCFSDFGRVSPDEIVFVDSIEAHFGECHRCKWPLWDLYEYEKFLDRKQRDEKQFNISDDLSNLDNRVLKGEIELVSTRVYSDECPILGQAFTGSTVSWEDIEEWLAAPSQSGHRDKIGSS